MPNDPSGASDKSAQEQEKRELLEYLLEAEGIELSRLRRSIGRRASHTPPPLSFSQERLWFLDQLEPGGTPYNILQSLRIEGLLNVAALKRSVNEVVTRHEILRTTFALRDDKLVQLVAPPSQLRLLVVELRELPPGVCADEAERLAFQHADRHIDLERGPLITFLLARIADETYELFIVVHQSIYDWFSVRILFDELQALYERFAKNANKLGLASLRIQYGDFAVWQREELSEEFLEPHVSYWRQQLGEDLQMLDLPGDWPRPPSQTYKGRRESVHVPRTLAEQLRALSQREGVSLFVTLMTAFKTLLYRYTGQENIIVGFPISNRGSEELENLIGSFVNTLVLRTDLPDNPTFLELMARVNANVLEAYAHQDAPFEKLVGELHLERDLGSNPLFQVMFILQNAPKPTPNIQDLRVTFVERHRGTSKFDITLALAEGAEGFVGSLEYSSDLFSESTIKRIIGHFQILLQSIVREPDSPISTLAILTEAEKQQLLTEWNQTGADYDERPFLHEQLEIQADKTPDAIALTMGDEHLSYRELNTRSNQLAHYLRFLGVGAEVLVGLCIGRSLDMILGLFGILKAGGAYIPLDPIHPEERIASMIRDSGIEVLVTRGLELGKSRSEKIRNVLSEFCDPPLTPEIQTPTPTPTMSGSSFPSVRRVHLDGDQPLIEQQPTENLASGVSAANLAYVIYTSGSTGEPKGVQISHQALNNFLCSVQKKLDLACDDVLFAVTTICFDIAALELYLPLIAGARVALASRQQTADASLLIKELEDSGATVMQATPSLWSLLLEVGWGGNQHLRILSGGETLSRDLANALIQRGKSVLNLFGPTETTVWSTLSEVAAGDRVVSIGHPIANTRIRILDRNLQLVPTIVRGDLYIGGDGLARGYLNSPNLTAQRFIPDPYGERLGDRMYLTGDRARYLHDGSIEFLGRSDHQVKIRGHRIEPAEIEATLRQHPNVEQAIVLAYNPGCDPQGRVLRTVDPEHLTPSLVAYLLPIDDRPTSSELHSFLLTRIPDYMIPSSFIFVDEIPLTANGKVDHKALRALEGRRPELDKVFVAPRNAAEEMLAGIWAEVLKLDHIGVHDDFFEIGGHSLLGTRVISRVNHAFGINVPLRTLFEAPTIASFAEAVDTFVRMDQGAPLLAMTRAPRKEFMPVSYFQQQLWFLDQLHPGMTTYNMPLSFCLRGSLDVLALEGAINVIIERHESLRSTFVAVEGSPALRIADKLRIFLPTVDLSELGQIQRETEAIRVANQVANHPFSLDQAPLICTALLRLDPDEHILLLTIHHIVCDAWSIAIFLRELTTIYNNAVSEAALGLPELTCQYTDFAVWQREWLQGETFDVHLAYWKEKLGQPRLVLELPTDELRAPGETSRGRRRSLRLSHELTKQLKELSRSEGVTRFMSLLASFDILLSKLSGQEDIVVGSTSAGRSHPELENVIGFFINALVLRTDLSGQPTFRELLARVREVCLGAHAHQEVPFDRLVEELRPEREPSRNPLFQVMFNMINVEEQTIRLHGLVTERFIRPEPPAKFDIVLYAPERDGAIELQMVFNTALFEEARIDAMLRQLRGLLEQIVRAPNDPVCSFSLVTPEDAGLLPDPAARLDDSWYGAVHDLFAKQARRHPDQLCVIDRNTPWTYGEMNTRSSQLANCLRQGGVQKEDVVGIYAHRDASLVLAVLGVLKAGGAFLILDPAYPPERLSDYCRLARVKCLITIEDAGPLPTTLRELTNTPSFLCRVDLPRTREQQTLSVFKSDGPNVETGKDDLAYVAFTSGSTGEPKGVLGRHGPLSHFLPWLEKEFSIDPKDRFSLISGLSFNTLHREMFTPLALGATIVIPDPDEILVPGYLAHWIDQQKISLLHLTPAMGQLLQHAREGTELPSVRACFFAGDTLTARDVKQVRRLAPGSRIVNFYGATETQRAVGYFNTPMDLGHLPDKLPIGKGIEDVQLLVLNRTGNLAGIGELGEIHVRSPHLARGYLNKDETQERFLTNPLTGDRTDRLYKTRELGRYLPDGNVELVGRIDRQINVRGFRIDLGEIDAVLGSLPNVRQCRVVARVFETRDSERTEYRLVAYVVPDTGEAVDDLHLALRAILPDHMIPAHFVFLAALPIDAHGKIDDGALPAPDEGSLQKDFIAPRTPSETAIARIWCEVLNLERVSMDQNFFELGGHSLLATIVIARIRDDLAVEVPVRSFLDNPTVLDVAAVVERLSQGRISNAPSDQDEYEEFDL